MELIHKVIYKTSEEESTFFPHAGYATRYDACGGFSELDLKLKPVPVAGQLLPDDSAEGTYTVLISLLSRVRQTEKEPLLLWDQGRCQSPAKYEEHALLGGSQWVFWEGGGCVWLCFVGLFFCCCC